MFWIRLPFSVPTFSLMTVYCFCFMSKNVKNPAAKDRNHESIHMMQHFELLLVSILLIGILALVFSFSAWWILLSLLMPFVLYVLVWAVEVILPPYGSAYMDSCFEREAYANESNFTYLYNRKPFAWLKWFRTLPDRKN